MYSTSHKTGNVAECSQDSKYLIKFAYNKAKKHLGDTLAGDVDDLNAFAGPAHLIEALATPGVFIYYLITSPILYRTKEDRGFQLDKNLEENL